MAIGLCIETSDEICSVAVNNSEGRVIELHSEESKSHGRILTGLIERALGKANLSFSNIDFIAVSSGPGSYTGLRIGIATAKGLCFAWDKPLIAIDVFEIIRVAAEKKDLLKSKIPFAMIDARRMEVYAQKWLDHQKRDGEAFSLILDESFIRNENLKKFILLGSGANKVNLIREDLNIEFHDIRPGAEFMIETAKEKFIKGQIEDVVYFEPFYLKEFYITKPKNVLKTSNGKRNNK